MAGFRFQNIPEKNHSFGLTKDITGSQAQSLAAHPAFFCIYEEILTEARGDGRGNRFKRIF